MSRHLRVFCAGLTAVLVTTTVATLGAQGLTDINSRGIPIWADSALRKAGVPGRYNWSSGVNPEMQLADFDGDGFLDLAVAIVPAGNRLRGLALVHRLDRSVHIVGAGEPLGVGAGGAGHAGGLRRGGQT